ncbi:MAG: CDP-diacylglycerol--glycerol-3-phosphate 3-phosphatidyltransferase [Mycoplasmataceae bacterium]|jgi:CDP-diacylglycerol--glycerol-3-phosphate 3-phosphatidyltransferase|nr:CDP-diacylglycerol--glycerol-3-phosphate 3-phosphatidyltransferase [Mycoplasmataceae bacterium]
MKLQPKHIPNILTIFRMALVPAIIVLLLIPPLQIGYYGISLYFWFDSADFDTYFHLNFTLAGCLFTLACITDWLDGFLARRNNWVSDFGKLWDPIADKILINSILICFLFQPNKGNASFAQYGPLIPIWIPIIMIIRDTVVEGTRIQAIKKGVLIPANIWGKLKTITQMIAILIIFFLFNVPQTDYAAYWFPRDFYLWYYLIQNIMMLVATAFSIISGVIYVYRFYKPKKTKTQ